MRKIAASAAKFVSIHETIGGDGMEKLEQRRLQQKDDVTERAWRVLLDCRQLIQERRALLAMRKQLLRHKDNVLLNYWKTIADKLSKTCD